jgi:hypothetical protein
MNTADSKILSEKDLLEALGKSLTNYIEGYKLLEKEVKSLEDHQQKFPAKYLTKASEGNYEDLLILASQLKHRSIKLNRNAAGLLVNTDTDLDYYEAQILLYFAEPFLKDKGFDKITDLLRNSYLSSSKEIKKLRVVKGKLKAVMESAESLVRAFESDEVNFRKFMDMKNKLRGI